MYTFPSGRGLYQDYDGEDVEWFNIGHDTLTGEEVALDPNGYCVHGVYVGGCGADYMCGHCEMGEFVRTYVPVAQVVVFGIGVEGRKVEFIEPPTTFEDALRSATLWFDVFEDAAVSTVNVCINEYTQMYWTDGKDD